MPERCSCGETGRNPRWNSVFSGSPGSQKTGGAWMQQSSQVSEQESWLQSVSPGEGSQLGHTICREPLQDPSPSPRRSSKGTHCNESTGFGNLKWSHEPEIETLGHRLGEHGVQTKTRETGMIAFPWGHTEEWGPKLWALGLEFERLPFSFSSLKWCRKPSGNKTHIEQSGASYIAWHPGKGGTVSPGAKTPENQCNRPLPEKISKDIQLRPSLLITQNCKTLALGENSI